MFTLNYQGSHVQKVFYLIVITSIFFFLPHQADAASPAKSGAKCEKLSTVQVVGGKKFTCVKNGNKLAWNKGVILSPEMSPSSPAPSSVPSPAAEQKLNPFDTNPFPDNFSRNEMVSAVFKNFDEFLGRKPSTNSYQLVIDDQFQSDAPAIKKLVAGIYSSLPFPPNYPRTVVVVSKDQSLLEQSIKTYSQFDRTGSSTNDWHICLNCGGLGWASITNGISSVTPHEIFHIWQRAAYKRNNDNNPDPNNLANPPVWFDEGGADFFGEAIYSKTSGAYQVPRVRWQPYKLEDYRTRNLDPGLPYSLGRAACEYIVASKGMDSFLQIYLNIGEGKNFPAAFESALGISLDKFYEKFDANLQEML